MVLMQTHKQEAIRHNPPWQSSLQNLLVSWGGSPGLRRWGGLGCRGAGGLMKGTAGQAVVQLCAFHQQMSAEQLGEHASRLWSAFHPTCPPAAAFLCRGTLCGEGLEDPLHPAGQWVRGEGCGRLTAWPDPWSSDRPDPLRMSFAVCHGPLC